MTLDDGTVPIRSFRVCFQLDRRLHKIDSYRLPVPYGIPFRGMGYAAATLIVVLLLGRLPVVRALTELLPWSIHYMALPVASAYLLMRWTIDGRAPHAAGLAWLRMTLRPARLCAFRRAAPPRAVRLRPVTIAPDESATRYRPGTVAGPARVVLRYPVQLEARGRTLRARPRVGGAMWRGKQIELHERQRLLIV